MSTIQRAFQKRFSGHQDYQNELQALDHVNLFPLPDPKQANEFIHLANVLLEMKPPKGGLSLCFASSISGEGASFVSYNVARQLAYVMNRSTVWLDGNFKSPQRALMDENGLTFADLLAGKSALPEARDNSLLRVIAGGHTLQSCARYLATDAYPELIAELTSRFDFTIIDGPPILDTVEAGLFAAGTDGLVVVVERKKLKWEVVRSGLDMLSNKRVKLLGTVFNNRVYELPRYIYNRL